MHISLLLHLRDVKARPEIILRALYAQRYVYRNTLILRTVHRNFKSNARAPAPTGTWGSGVRERTTSRKT